MKSKSFNISSLSLLASFCLLLGSCQSGAIPYSRPSSDSSSPQSSSSDETPEEPLPSSDYSESIPFSSGETEETEEIGPIRPEVTKVQGLPTPANVDGFHREEDGFYITTVSNGAEREWNPEWEPEYVDIKIENVRFEFACSVPFNGESWGIPENGQEKWAFEVGLEYKVSLRAIFYNPRNGFTYCSPVGFDDGSLLLSESAPATIEDGKRITAHGEGAFTLSLECYGETVEQLIEAKEQVYDYDGYHTLSFIGNPDGFDSLFPGCYEFRYGDRIVVGTIAYSTTDSPYDLFINRVRYTTRVTNEEATKPRTRDCGGKSYAVEALYAGNFPPFDCTLRCAWINNLTY